MPVHRLAGIRIDIQEAGHGPPLLFLHGAGGLTGREPFLGPLAEGRRLIAPSHPGFGDSDLPDWMDRVSDIAILYLDLLDRIGHAEVDVIGCSFGGWIALELAVLVPHRIRGLVLVAPAGLRMAGHEPPNLFTLPEDERAGLLYHDVARYRPDPTRMDAIDAARAWRDRQSFARFAANPYLHNPKLGHWLHRISSPVMLMRGEHDGLISADHLAACAKAFADARIATIPAAGHLPQIEQPALFTDLAMAFLRGEL
jgi:pimeloyl-ACP methyl ester carboxylesterase